MCVASENEDMRKPWATQMDPWEPDTSTTRGALSWPIGNPSIPGLVI